MRIVQTKLMDPHFDNVRTGKKIFETRVYDDKRKAINVGDVFEFRHNSDTTRKTFKTVIVGIKVYKSFTTAIKDSGVKKVLPNVRTLEDAVKIYENFPHSEGTFKDGATKFGVVRFELAIYDTIY